MRSRRVPFARVSVGRIVTSLLLCYGQIGAATAWLKANGPLLWIFLYAAAVELLFLLQYLYKCKGSPQDSPLWRRVNRGAKIGSGVLLVFGAAAIIVGLNVTPASAYLAWFQLVREGIAGGTLAYMFAVKFAFFAALFSGLFLVGSRSFALLNLAAVDLLIVAVLMGKPALAAIGAVLFLLSIGRRAVRRTDRQRSRAVASVVQIALISAVIALPLSVAHLPNRLIDDLFSIRMEGMVADVFPTFPFLYNVPGYGYSLSSSQIGDRPALTSRPVFQITAPEGSTIYVRTGVYDTYTGTGWELSDLARRLGEREVGEYEASVSSPPPLKTSEIEFKVLIDFYSSLPHTLRTVAFRFPNEEIPTAGVAGLGSGFILENPLRRGTTILDLVARPGQSPPATAIGSGFGGRPELLSTYLNRRENDAGDPPVPARRTSTGQSSATDVSGSSGDPPRIVALPGEGASYGQPPGALPLTSASEARQHSSNNPPRLYQQFGAAPGRQDPNAVDSDGDNDFGRRTGFGHFAISGGGQFETGSYRGSAAARRDLAAAQAKYGIQASRFYLTPWERAADLETGDLPNKLVQLAARLGAGRTHAETLRAIRSYLVENYQYSLNTSPGGPYHDAVSDFLFDSKKGFCVQFASAFVILARLNGIPARYVTGFLAEMPANTNQMTITGLSAHSWAETWNNTVGWVTQEATPPMIAAASGNPNVLSEYNPTDSTLTQRQLEAVLGNRLSAAGTSSSVPGGSLSNDISRMGARLPLLPVVLVLSLIVMGAVALLVRAAGWRLAPLDRRFDYIVRKIARRSNSRGLPDPAAEGWRSWSVELGRRIPGRREVARRAAAVIHRSFFSARRSERRSRARDLAFLTRLYRVLPKRRKRNEKGAAPGEHAASRN